jgi:hypothetical protein
MFGLGERVARVMNYGDHINAKGPVIRFGFKVLAVIPAASTKRSFTESRT